MRHREWVVVLGFVHWLAGCSGESDGGTSKPERGDIGEPCLLADESDPNFSGFSIQESYAGFPAPGMCENAVCLANHFQGRVSCPYGQSTDQAATDPLCFLPGSNDPITVPVDPQLVERSPAMTMTCSCQCGGAGTDSPCDCPSGTTCTSIFPLTGGDDAPKYCIIAGSLYDPTHPPSPEICLESSANCGDPRPLPP